MRPAKLSLAKPGDTAELDAKYHGRSQLNATSQDASAATVSKTGSLAFTVSATGVGKTTIVVQDTTGNSFAVGVMVR